MGEHGVDEPLDVLRLDVLAPLERAIARAPRSSASEPQNESGADTGKLARRANQVDHPALQERVDVRLLDCTLQRPQIVDPDHGLEPVERMPVPLRPDDLELLGRLRVAERRLEEEAVKLGLGGEDALVVERVLRCEDEERARQRARLSVDRDLPFGHGLEERALRSRHRPVDLVDEQDVREDRPGLEREDTLSLVVHQEARHVGRLDRSGVHWIRAVVAPSSERAIARASTVLAVPGTSSRRTCPSQRSAQMTRLDLAALAEHDALDVVEQRLQDGARIPRRAQPLLARRLVADWRCAASHGARLGWTPRHA